MRALARGVVADKDSGALRAASEGAGSSQLNFWARCARIFFYLARAWARGVVTDKDSGALRAASEGAGSSQLNCSGALRARFFLSGESVEPAASSQTKILGPCVRRLRAQGRHS